MTDSSWRTVEIGELCGAIFDGPHATPKKTATGPIFLGISNLANGRLDDSNTEHLSPEDFARWTRRGTPQADDVVFSYETRLGEAARIPRGLVCCLGRRMALMRPNRDKVDPRFLLYAYLGPDFQETIRTRTIHGSTVDRIPLVEFPSFPIRIPPLSEQRAIARVLGTLDDKIELNRRMSRTLEAIIRHAFTKRFLNKSSGGRRGSLGNVADMKREAVDPSTINEDTPYIGLEHMPRRSIALFEWANSQGLASGKSTFEAGDILFGKLRPYFHKVGVAPIGGVCSTDMLVISPKKPHWFGFVLGHVMSDELIRYADATSTGTKMPRTSWKDLARFEISIPPDDVAAGFEELVQPLVRLMTATIHEARTLAAIRDALLPKLISGEIRVGEAEELVEAAT